MAFRKLFRRKERRPKSGLSNPIQEPHIPDTSAEDKMIVQGDDVPAHVPTPVPAANVLGSGDVVRSFGGFDDWLASFTPSETSGVIPQPPNIPELPEGPISELASPQPGRITVTIKGLRMLKSSNGDGSLQDHIVNQEVELDNVLLQTPLITLCKTIEQRGYDKLYGHFQQSKRMDFFLPTRFPIPTVVTQEQSSYNCDEGFAINQDETLGSFYCNTEQNGAALTAKLDDLETQFNRDQSESTTLMVEGFGSCLKIRFHRTVRVPQNAQVHHLPPDLGCIPMRNVVNFAEKMPEDMSTKGGIFFPLYQREAVWISFESRGTFSVRVYAGGVNVLSSDAWNKKSTRESSLSSLQDYIVIPPQKWLDGIVTGPGEVKQFVAMPLGAEYSIEKQVTGKESLAGLQFLITPSFPDWVGFWPHFALGYPQHNPNPLEKQVVDQSARYNLAKSPRELGLAPGTLMYRVGQGEIKIPARSEQMEETAMGKRPILLADILEKVDGPQTHLEITVINALLLLCIFRDMDTGKDIAESWIKVSPWDNTLALRHIVDETRKRINIKLVLDRITIPRLSPRDGNRTLYDLGNLDLRDGTSILAYVGAPDRVAHSDEPFPAFLSFGAGRPSGWSMAVAAGGTIRQDICKDTNPPDIWIKSATTMLNAQILNSVAFESVTGIMAPPTPITAETYIKAGFPFFQEYQECPPAKYRKFFKAIKSVSDLDATKDIKLGDSVASASPTACTICKKNLCDCILRPCNHALCSMCVIPSKGKGPVSCSICQQMVSNIVGFSAPMAIPGHEPPDLIAKAVTMLPTNMFEFEANRSKIHELDAPS